MTTKHTAPAGPPSRRRRRRLARLVSLRAAVPVVLIATGVLLAVSAATSRGTQLRSPETSLAQLVADEQRRVQSMQDQAAQLRQQVDAATRQQASHDQRVASLDDQASQLGQQLGLSDVTGTGLEVVLNDAPASARTRPPPPGVAAPTPDDLVVHQQDIQAVVNALWSGGAEAMTVMGQRMFPSLAVRCVGNTLLLAGAVYSPPYVVRAIGDPQRLRAALDAEAGVAIYRQYVTAYGLGFEVRVVPQLHLPPYTGPIELTHASVAP